MIGIKKFNIPIREIISWVLALLGVVATLVSAFRTEQNGFGTIFIGLLVLEVIVIVVWLLLIWENYTHNKERKEFQDRIAQLETESQNAETSYSDQITVLKKSQNNILEQMAAIGAMMKNISKLNNDFCTRIPDIAEKSYHFLEIVKNGEIKSNERIKEEMIQAYMEFAVGLLDLYRRYSKNMLNHLVEIEEAYLSAKGYSSLPVSATVKFYDRPFCPQKDERKGIHVYTAFRDSRTYDKHEREIGEKLYTIDGNADFGRCLQKEHFLINNAVRNSDSYMNEHTDFDAYYNCTIVVPIRAKLSDGSYKHFGYLCCDCLNSERKCEIFDQPAAQYLFAVAQQYATFLDTLDANWIDRTKELSELPGSILHMIYRKTYIGESGTAKEIP